MACDPNDNSNNKLSLYEKIIPMDDDDVEQAITAGSGDYKERAQWLRAAVLGATDGILSIASLMVGIEAVHSDARTIALTVLAGLFAGACSMALGELVSVYSQYDIELAHLLRVQQQHYDHIEVEDKKKGLPCPFKAATASGLAFAAGAAVPLLAAAFITEYKTRLAVVVATVSLTLFAFGWLGAVLGRSPPVRSSLRVLVGGWLAMAVTFGLTKMVGSTHTGI